MIQFLDLRGLHLCDLGIIKISETLKNNKILNSLILSNNDFTHCGL